MKLIFINPPKNQTKDDHVVNMALFWLVSVLERHGIESKVYTVLGDRIYEDIDRIIKESRPEIIGITCKWWNTLYSATYIADYIKRNYPDIFLFTGGHTATIFAKELVSRSSFDAVLLGDSEKSIVELARGNCQHGIVYRKDAFWDRNYETTYFLEDVYRLPKKNIDYYIDRPDLVMAYVWLGRGCYHNCFYCAENVDTAKKIFCQRTPFIRSVESVADDISRLGERSFIVFDYEYPSFDRSDRYIEQLSKLICAQKDYRLYFFAWGLPSKYLIDVISKYYSYACICIDVQCFSEQLRKKLSDIDIIKPFVSDADIIDTIEYIESKGNIILDATGIVGYPFETDEDRERTEQWILELHSNYSCVRDFRPSPLHTIPGTTMTDANTYFDLTIVRSSYDDFYQFTKESFYNNLPYYSTARKNHPYGNYPAGRQNVIPEFIHSFNQNISQVKCSEITVRCTCKDDILEVFIENKYSPLVSLMEVLRRYQGQEVSSLHICLGKHTWFHNSYYDYTSESGENCAALFNGGRDASELRRELVSLLEAYHIIVLEDPESSAWGIVKEAIEQ